MDTIFVGNKSLDCWDEDRSEVGILGDTLRMHLKNFEKFRKTSRKFWKSRVILKNYEKSSEILRIFWFLKILKFQIKNLINSKIFQCIAKMIYLQTLYFADETLL